MTKAGALCILRLQYQGAVCIVVACRVLIASTAQCRSSGGSPPSALSRSVLVNPLTASKSIPVIMPVSFEPQATVTPHPSVMNAASRIFPSAMLSWNSMRMGTWGEA